MKTELHSAYKGYEIMKRQRFNGECYYFAVSKTCTVDYSSSTLKHLKKLITEGPFVGNKVILPSSLNIANILFPHHDSMACADKMLFNSFEIYPDQIEEYEFDMPRCRRCVMLDIIYGKEVPEKYKEKIMSIFI